ncbi:asparagine synthase (glutamine-hydrolyzing) [Methanoregula sp. UBA64]|jgi:asparagine synthase (glutamine-hydrolysing)|uniref:asparagine synthase (glutamine-hydrolyzing) n=1 Tax=Methanoregula sp. UBA64 TaxID=1915554 RepID=UPI0025E8BBF9|nr:asparagine synthase (glutamine-hydrolyzing) [Methanoregula sp. UBA64]
MCGIAGQYCYASGRPDRRLLASMSERLAHRGPDGEGLHTDELVGLVHRRLAIIDLSPDGLQPMTNEDCSLWLVFNGEIYNFVELREELMAKGHVFSSKSDTEVILHAYEEWGHGCLARFNGMWAFALWDEKKQELFCARDRFGIKPFYYTKISGSFLFASEIKALLVHPDVGRTPDDGMLRVYLTWGVQDHCGRTMFEGISQIGPGHAMVVGRDGKAEPFRYWDVTVNPALSDTRTDDEVATRLRGLLHDATRIHLRSDVAVGTCLSGGIDSSTLTAIISGIIKEDAPESVGALQKTFSVVFPKTQYDESRYIDEIVAATRVDATMTEPAPADLETDIKRLVYMQDEPFGSLSIYAQYCVMRLAQTKVKVVLDGQGADELLAGYLGYQASYIRGLLKRFNIPAAFSEALGSLKEHRGFFVTARAQLRARRGRRTLILGTAQPVDRYAGTLDEVLHRELISTNLPALLHYEDRNSMAFSIESRVPYLDVRLVEYLAGLPLNQKIRNGVTKWSLRAAIVGLVPDSIRCRRDKMGFVTPEECWMKNELRDFMQGIFSSESFCFRPYWDAKAVKEDYDAFLNGTSAYSPEIWRIACTELWLRTFIDRPNGIRPG